MSRGHRNCEICGIQEKMCSDKVFFARFPLCEFVCKQWVKVVGKEDLAFLPIEKLHELRYVCGKHFEKRDFTKSKTRLKKTAIPKCNLAAPPLPDDFLEGFPLHTASKNKQAPASVKSHKEYGPRPSTSKQNEADVLITPASVKSHKEYGPERPSTSKQNEADVLTTPASVKSHKEYGPERPSTSKQNETDVLTRAASVTSLKEYCPERPSTSKQYETQVSRTPVGEDPVLTEYQGKLLQNTQTNKGVKRKLMEEAELTPRKRKLVQDLLKTKCTLKSLRKSSNLIEQIESPILKEIVLNAAKNQKRKPTGRRWTIKNKISALAIYKRSPRTYRFLNQVLPLPSEKTLQNILKKVPIEPGISKSLLQHLAKIAPTKSEKEKVCCLLYDEMAIKPRLLLNTGNDCVEGFEDLGELGRTKNVADHALVFMLQGLYKKFKQPVAFYFTQSTISSQNLSVIIKNIITQITSCGYKILCTVCDQGSTNIGAHKILREDSGPLEDASKHYFLHNGEKILIIYDVPHLFKSIRNNFLNNGTIVFTEKTGKWAHLVQVARENDNFLYLSKISETHVNPKYKAKMRVKYAAQILSNTVSAVLKLLSRAENDPLKKEQLSETAEIIRKLDRLFDMTNGPSGPKDKKKGIRENVSQKSNHMEFWTDCIKKMKTMKFINRNGKTATNVKCVEGFIITMKSLRDIWQYVSKLGFKYLNLRQTNQDALENLFGLLRQQSPTNRNPTAAHFIAALKTAVVTKNWTTPIRGANCEQDGNDILTGFRNIIFDDDGNKEKQNKELDKINELETFGELEHPVISIPDFFNEEDVVVEELIKISGQATVYVAGYLASKILKNNNCQNCRQDLCVENPTDLHEYIALREWWQEKISLTYPTISLCKMVQTATEVIEGDVMEILHKKNVTQLAVTLFEVQCDSTWFSCKQHVTTITVLYKTMALLLIRRACQKINTNYALKEVSVADASKKAEQQGTAK